MAENNRIAVCLHLYYAEQLPDMLKYLRNLRQSGVPYDLYVSLPEPREEIEQALRAAEPAVEIWHPANRGYDIGPFIDFLHKIDLAQYAFILKIHTKNRRHGEYGYFNGRRFSTAAWSRILQESLLGSPDIIRKNFSILENNPRIGMLGAAYCLTGEAWAYKMLESSIVAEAHKLGLPQAGKFKFFAGTMFMARTEVLKPFLHYTLADFAPSAAAVRDYTLAHIVERLFGYAATALGYTAEGVMYKQYRMESITAEIMRFLIQQKTTKKGRNIIKICKIPVWSSREKLPVMPVNKEFLPNPPHHRRLAIYAAYDAAGSVDKADLYYIRALKEVADNVIYVADNGLVAGEAEKLARAVVYIEAAPHGEYDFGSYKRGFEYARTHGLLQNIDELILCNDSCYAPVHPLAPMFEKMRQTACDFWGITENTEFSRHIQSYFMVFRPQVFNSEIFAAFMSGITRQPDVRSVIGQYEVGLSKILMEKGFVAKSYIEYPASGEYPLSLAPAMRNLTAAPLWLMRQGSPFLKKKALWQREANIERKPLYAKIYACRCNKGLKGAMLPSRKIIQEELKRFLFQTKTTKSGKKIVKICKLPVYCREVR